MLSSLSDKLLLYIIMLLHFWDKNVSRLGSLSKQFVKRGTTVFNDDAFSKYFFVPLFFYVRPSDFAVYLLKWEIGFSLALEVGEKLLHPVTIAVQPGGVQSETKKKHFFTSDHQILDAYSKSELLESEPDKRWMSPCLICSHMLFFCTIQRLHV